VWHLANAGVVTPRDLLLAAAEISKLDADLIEGVPFWSLHRAADRPRYRALESERAPLLPPLADALQRYCTDAARAILELDAAVAVR
jgi:dTDP-4-dehydrorhamnose reductase